MDFTRSGKKKIARKPTNSEAAPAKSSHSNHPSSRALLVAALKASARNSLIIGEAVVGSIQLREEQAQLVGPLPIGQQEVGPRLGDDDF